MLEILVLFLLSSYAKSKIILFYILIDRELFVIYKEELKLRRIGVMICIFILSLCICLSACGEQNNSTNSRSNSGSDISEQSDALPLEIVEMFFAAFETSDYELMKTYCTKECIDTYFHDNDVNGMIWAKAVKSEEEPKTSDENECSIFVDVKMETAKTSALYGESETSFYVVLNKTEDDSWAINRFATGL